MTKGCHPVVF